MRLTVDEYSKHFKMSKEMVHSRLKSRRLNYIIEEGITYIIVPRSSLESDKRRELHEEKKVKQQQQKADTPKPKTTAGTIIALYQRENQHLKNRIRELEAKIDKLIDDKEQMLIGERDRIEQIYSNKDEQLKTILNLVNTKLMLSQESSVHDVDIDEQESISANGFVELKKYLKSLDMTSHQRKTVKKRFAAAFGNDSRVVQQNGEFYLDFNRFDYSDLLEH
jgi:cell division protein FtsB